MNTDPTTNASLISDVRHFIEQDLQIVLQNARTLADQEVADAASRLITAQEQGLLQITVSVALVATD